MPPSNMSIQTGSDRPSMKQDDHPEHNMPESEHDGVETKLSDTNYGNVQISNRAVMQSGINTKKAIVDYSK